MSTAAARSPWTPYPEFRDMSEHANDERPAYVAPKVTVMNEAEVLKSFQITSAATTWWSM